MKRTLALIMAVFLVGLMSTEYAYAITDEPGAQKQQQVMVVKNPKGESLGTVTNALVDYSGNIVFVILSIREKEEEQEKEIAVPSVIFAYDGQSKALLLNVSKEQLASAPKFNDSDLSDPAFTEKIYRFYGLILPPDRATGGEKRGDKI